MYSGFEAYEAVLQLEGMRDKFTQFRIPMVVLPATISNNVPGKNMIATRQIYYSQDIQELTSLLVLTLLSTV